MSRAAAEVRRVGFAFDLPTAERIRGDLWLPDRPVAETALVVCHGFKGFKDWGFFPYLSEELARRTGIAALCFNFTGSGVSRSTDEFDDLEAFGRNTFTRELQDLEAVLDHLAMGRLGEVELPRARRYGLLGHSRGGATALLKAALRHQVRALATWSAIASVERYRSAFAAEWESGGPAYVENKRTGQMMPLYRNVMDDMRANRGRFDLRRAAAALEIPWLIIHGSEDESVPEEDARTLADAAGDRAELVLIEGAGHTLNASHPFTGSNAKLERAIELSARHIGRALGAA